MTAFADCTLCESEQREAPAVVYRSEHWSVGPALHRGVPGWLLLWSRAHTPGFDAVDRAALHEYGEMLGDTTRLLKEVVGTPKVYVVVFGDHEEHTHALLMARPPGIDPGRTGVSMLHEFDDLRAPDGGRSVATEIGARLAHVRQDIHHP
jgi:diadenosine tetraphosphate (Ap4A) HIT family hydrolase